MKEDILFNLIKTKLVPDLETTDQYNPTDGISKEKKLAIELKCRTKYYRYCLIEKSKYDKLIQFQKARYINSIPNGENTEIYSWNIKKLTNLNWQLRWMPASTQFNRTQWVEKMVAFIDIRDAINITKTLLSE